MQLGSVSSGTMRYKDLIPCFESELAMLSKTALRKIHVAQKKWEKNEEIVYYYLNSLFDALNERCPLFCYFGASEGDGANYGCWFSRNALEDAISCREVVKVNAGEEYPEDWKNNYEYLVEVNDHGNVTIIDRKERIVLEVV